MHYVNLNTILCYDTRRADDFSVAIMTRIERVTVPGALHKGLGATEITLTCSKRWDNAVLAITVLFIAIVTKDIVARLACMQPRRSTSGFELLFTIVAFPAYEPIRL